MRGKDPTFMSIVIIQAVDPRIEQADHVLRAGGLGLALVLGGVELAHQVVALDRQQKHRTAAAQNAYLLFDATPESIVMVAKKSDGTVLSSFDYAYDNVGNPTSMVELSGDRVTWSYGNAYQLTREQRSGTDAYDITYTNYWIAVIEALILAKVIMIGAVLRLGRGLRRPVRSDPRLGLAAPARQVTEPPDEPDRTRSASGGTGAGAGCSPKARR